MPSSTRKITKFASQIFERRTENLKEQNISKKTQVKEKPFDFLLFITILILLAMGIIMVLSASSPKALSEGGDSYSYVKRQATFAIIGIGLMLIISKIDYKIYSKFANVAYIGSIIILISTKFLGSSSKGAERWLDLGFVRFQPSEIAKIALIIFYAAWLTKNKDKLKELKKGFVVPFVFILPIAAILLLLQNHLSVTIIIVAVMSIMMLMAGTKLKYFLITGVIVAVIGGSALFTYIKVKGPEDANFRLARITTFLDPWSDAKGDGWQIIQSLYAIGSGGLFGVGLGESKQKFLYIPEPHNDFIFAVLAEELGFLGCIVVIVLFAVFIWRGLLIGVRAKDMFGSLLAVGITSLVGLQAIMNIAVVTASMPNTGIPLPFFSYGGTALVILLCSMGILLNISRSAEKV